MREFFGNPSTMMTGKRLLLLLLVQAFCISACASSGVSESPTNEPTGPSGETPGQPTLPFALNRVLLKTKREISFGGQTYPVGSYVYDFDSERLEALPLPQNVSYSYVTYADITTDGRYVAYFVHLHDVGPMSSRLYRYDAQTQTSQELLRIEDPDHNYVQAWHPKISDDGKKIAFASSSRNLVVNDTNEMTDIFVLDIDSLSVERVSLTHDDQESVVVNSSYRSMATLTGDLSADGRLVLFRSWASDLVPNDTNNAADSFVRDLVGGTTERVSVEAETGDEVNSLTVQSGFLGTTNQIFFSALASFSENIDFIPNSGLSSGEFGEQLYIRPALGQTALERLSITNSGRVAKCGYTKGFSDGFHGVVADASARMVAFSSSSGSLLGLPVECGGGRYVQSRLNTPPDWVSFGERNHSQVFIRDRDSGATRLISQDGNGRVLRGPCYRPQISSDGTEVFFECESRSFRGDSEPVDQQSFFVKRLSSGTLERIF